MPRHNDRVAYCQRCADWTAHRAMAEINEWGTKKIGERCAVCGVENGSHEAPKGDAPQAESVLTTDDMNRLRFLRHLIARGIVNDDDRPQRVARIDLGGGKFMHIFNFRIS